MAGQDYGDTGCVSCGAVLVFILAGVITTGFGLVQFAGWVL
jgi:hypothetical protein